MVTYRGESLNLVVNLNKNVEGGAKFVFKIRLQSRTAGGFLVYETRKKYKMKSGPDEFTMGQASKKTDCHMFEKAKDEEDKQLIDEKILGAVHEYKDLPRRATLVGSMYTSSIKRNKSTGAIERYKARLVA